VVDDDLPSFASVDVPQVSVLPLSDCLLSLICIAAHGSGFRRGRSACSCSSNLFASQPMEVPPEEIDVSAQVRVGRISCQF